MYSGWTHKRPKYGGTNHTNLLVYLNLEIFIFSIWKQIASKNLQVFCWLSTSCKLLCRENDAILGDYILWVSVFPVGHQQGWVTANISWAWSHCVQCLVVPSHPRAVLFCLRYCKSFLSIHSNNARFLFISHQNNNNLEMGKAIFWPTHPKSESGKYRNTFW